MGIESQGMILAAPSTTPQLELPQIQNLPPGSVVPEDNELPQAHARVDVNNLFLTLYNFVSSIKTDTR